MWGMSVVEGGVVHTSEQTCIHGCVLVCLCLCMGSVCQYWCMWKYVCMCVVTCAVINWEAPPPPLYCPVFPSSTK